MPSARRACRNKPDVFCYICGEYTLVPNRKPAANFVKRAFHAYFGMKFGDQDKAWAPHMVCKSCTEHLRQWTKGTRKSLNFGIPMVWKELSNHATDCYFCAIDTTGINRKNLGCNMSIKMHYPFSHMDWFPENLGSMSDEQGKRFHQDMKEMETRYQGRWDAVMMADYCWTLKKGIPVADHSRSSKKRKLKP